jgi:predicted DNA-binding transcriptional regulator YafY
MMRASRLLSLLLLLQTRGRMTAAQLAEELEVSVRTIYRDVEALHSAGVPLYGDAGPAGGYELIAGYRTRLTGLTSNEADALFLTGMPGPAAELGLGAVVAAAQLKLKAAIPVELRERADQLQQRFHLDAPGWYHDGDASTHLPAVAGAVWQQNLIDVRYQSWTRVVNRRLRPYGLVIKAGKWYLVADAGRGPRTYRVNQIQELYVLPEEFERPADFDLAAYWRSYVVEFRSRLRQGEALVRLSPEAMQRLADLMSEPVIRAVQDGQTDADGWVRARVPIESLINAETEFLRFGAEVEILEPAELRARLTATATRLAALYRS